MRSSLLLALALAQGTSLLAQNSCDTAIPLNEGTFVVPSVDGFMSPVNCLMGNPTNAEWYTFTSPVDTGVVITTNLAGLPAVDTRIQVFTGTCASLQCYVSDDDSGGNWTSLVQFFAAANVTYTIIFDDNWTDNGFQFNLSLFPPPPPPANLIDFAQIAIPGMGYSMGLVDMNKDGKDDIVAPSASNVRIGYQQNDGTFQFVDIATPTADHPASWSFCVGDLDKNGANDLMYGAGNGVTLMYANANGTAFTERSYTEYVFCQRTNMVDLNNDGHLDAFSCHDVDANVAFINNGTDDLDFVQGGYGETCGNYGSVFTDMDNDGLMDLFVAKCGCDPKDLMMPNSPGGVFTDIAPALGWDDNHQSWSSAWGDFDNDGDMDGFIGSSSSTVHKLMRNNGDGTFTDITNLAGANANNGQSIEWTTHDFNNDGWLDVLGGAGMLVNNGDGTFTFDNSVPTNGPIGDLNNDGYLDVLSNGSNAFINQSSGNNWLRIDPIGSVSNSNGIGARVRVISNGLSQIRDIKSGDGFRYMSSLMAHFGLGQANTATVEVHWPSGIVDIIEEVDANQVLRIYEGLSTVVDGMERAELAVFPVPAMDRISLSGAETNNSPARIFASTGQLVHNDVVRNSTINIARLQPGVYLLEVATSNGVLKTRFVKE